MIVIYGNLFCNYCLRAKKLAERYSLSYEWKDLDIDSNMNEFKIKFPSAKSIPQIEWDGRYIGGYDELAEEIENTIGDYGQNGF